MKQILLAAMLLSASSGCSTWDSFSPATQSVLKAGAKLALSYGVNELGDRVKELRPYQDRLNTLIETTFAQPLDAEATGSALRAGMAKVVPAELQGVVLAEFKKQLEAKTVATVAGRRPQTADFNARLAAALGP